MRVTGSGYGAGARDVPGRPNVLPALLGEPVEDETAGLAELTAAPGMGGHAETLIMVETTVNDVTGELLGDLPGLLLGAGALDAWITAVTGKKGRPAHVVSALCRPGQDEPVLARLLAETGSLGARRHPVQRSALPRREAEVTVRGTGSASRSARTGPSPSTTTWPPRPSPPASPRHVIAGQALSQLDQEPA